MTEGSHDSTPAPSRRRPGVRRMADLLDAAAGVFAERGYAAATMAEIASRAGARIGSLYYFFPNKEAVAQALVDRYVRVVEADYAAFDAGGARRPVAALADFLVEAIVRHGDETRALVALLDARGDAAGARGAVHAWASRLIAATLRAHAPTLPAAQAEAVAAVVLANMKLMAELAADPEAPDGAARELRAMNRLYLEHRLPPG